MNATFNLNRFWKLIITETLINKNTIIILLLALFGLLSLSYFFTFVEIQKMQEPNFTYDNTFTMMVMIVIAPFFLYKNLYNKVKSVRYAMLPASQLEKIISAIIQTNILISVLGIIVYWIFIFIVRFIIPTQLMMDFSGHFFEEVFRTIQIQSLVFLGVFWFKEKKLIKMLLTFIMAITALTIAGYLFVNNKTIASFVINNFEWLSDFFAKYGKIIFNVLIPLGPWLISYKKFTKTQV